MKCEICGTLIKKIGSDFICRNGHTIQNMDEVVDETNQFQASMGISKKIKKLKEKDKTIRILNKPLTNFIILRLFFKEAKRFFSFETEKIFLNFTGLYRIVDVTTGREVRIVGNGKESENWKESDKKENWKESDRDKEKEKEKDKNDRDKKEGESDRDKREKDKSDHKNKSDNTNRNELSPSRTLSPSSPSHNLIDYVIPDVNMKSKYKNCILEGERNPTIFLLFGIIYLSKRSEEEGKGKIYTLKEFINKLGTFMEQVNLKELEFVYKFKGSGLFSSLGKTRARNNLFILITRIRELCDYNIFFTEDQVKPLRFSETGLIPKEIDLIKGNIRGSLKRDLKILEKYFDKICEDLGIEQNEEMLFYFKKMIWARDWNKVLIPEVEFTFFIVNYWIYKGRPLYAVGDLKDGERRENLRDGERREGVHERRESVHERRESVHERRESVHERRESVHERRESDKRENLRESDKREKTGNDEPDRITEPEMETDRINDRNSDRINDRINPPPSPPINSNSLETRILEYLNIPKRTFYLLLRESRMTLDSAIAPDSYYLMKAKESVKRYSRLLQVMRIVEKKRKGNMRKGSETIRKGSVERKGSESDSYESDSYDGEYESDEYESDEGLEEYDKY